MSNALDQSIKEVITDDLVLTLKTVLGPEIPCKKCRTKGIFAAFNSKDLSVLGH